MRYTQILTIAALLLFGSVANAAQVSTKFIKDLAVTPAKISSGSASDGYVLTADGSGNAAFEAVGASGTHAQEVPGGTINGENTAFTLAHTPTADATVLLFLDGSLLRQGTDYTISGDDITATGVIPATGQRLDAKYIY